MVLVKSTAWEEQRNRKPRRTMCSGCPHQVDVRQGTCDVREGRDLWALGLPHVCHNDQEFLCRGCVEQFKLNGIEY